MNERFIAIVGLIASGKTTLAKKLGEIMDLPVYYEQVIDNKYLDDFYKDQEKYAFPLQIYLLNKRFKQQQKLIWNNEGGIQDRSIYEDSIFCKMLCKDNKISIRDYETYIELFQNMSNFMKKPTLIVFLHVSPEESYKRLKGRNRKCEKGVTLKYLQSLYKYYDEFINEISSTIPVLKINYEKFKDPKEMATFIKNDIQTRKNIIEILS